MLENTSIRKKVTLSGVISAAMTIIIALVAWNGLRGLSGALEDATRNATAQKNHLNADMMHEGLKADVLSALYSAANGDADKDGIIKAQTQENARMFRDLIKANRELIGTGILKAKFAEAETEMERYVSHAESIVAQAFTDPAGAAKQLDAFNDEFKRLEDKLHDVSEFIEDQNRKAQEAGAAKAKADMRAIVIASLFALLAIVVVTVVIPRSIMTKLAQINALGASVASAATKGDLTVRAEVHGDDEVGTLARQMNDILGGFQHSVTEIRDAVAKLVSITDDVASVSRETSEGVNRQHAETEQVATAMNEMTATVQEIAQNSQRTAQSATQGNEAADSGRRVVAQAIESMDVLSQQVDRAVGVLQKLKADSGNIGVVLDVIRSIAEQTNLLALNAAIEAARAGEQGRGFAVVADEVRTLAQRTQQSTREIQDMIQRLQTGVGEVAATMEQGQQQTRAMVQKVSEAGTALDAITAAVSTITDMSSQIATTTEEQSKTTEEINRNISNISGVADQVAASAQRAAGATREMAQLAQLIDELVKKFKLG